MSLLICSNVQDEYASYDQEGDITNIPTGIQNPATFTNHLRNPIKIAPNSEVAVSSVKINRLPVWDIKAGNRFFFNQGIALEDANGNPVYKQSDTFSVPVPVLVPEGTYTQTEMQILLQKLLREAQSHPNFWNKVNITDFTDNPAVLSQKWKGFNMKFGALAGPTANSANKMTDWEGFDARTEQDPGPAATGGHFDIVVDATPQCIITRELVDGLPSTYCSAINRNCPMDLLTGLVEMELFDFGERTNQAGFFFTRPKLYSDVGNPLLLADGERGVIGGATGSSGPSKYGGDEVCYADYRIDWTTQASDIFNHLVLSQAVWDPTANDGAGATIMKEINYWEGLPGGDGGVNNPVKTQINGNDITNPDAGGANQGATGYIGKFKTEFIGTGIKVSMGYHINKQALKEWRVICDTTLVANRVNHDKVWTPINQNKEALYMGVSMADVAHEIAITKMVWNEDEVSKHLTNPYKYGRQESSVGANDAVIGSSFWSKCIQGKAEGDRDGLNLELAKLVEMRENKEQKAGSIIHWTDKSVGGDAIGYDRALIVSNKRDSEPEAVGTYHPARGANMGNQLGFPYWDSVSSKQMGKTLDLAGGKADLRPNAVWDIASADVPKLKAHSAFVKVPSLTPQSYNFCKSIPSQILYHMPRFDNSGREYGELFFECPEKTYIDMKNIDFLNLNQLSLMVVDKDERIVKDLSGDTTIVLHIRHKSQK